MTEIRHKHRGPCSLCLLVQWRLYFSVLTVNETSQQHLVNIRHMKFNGTPLKNYRGKMCAPLGYYAAYGGNSLPNFRDKTSAASSRV